MVSAGFEHSMEALAFSDRLQLDANAYLYLHTVGAPLTDKLMATYETELQCNLGTSHLHF